MGFQLSIVVPESGGERQKDGEDFQTSCEHEEGADPESRVGHGRPSVERTNHGAESRTDIAHAGDADGKGIKQGRSYQEIDEGAEHYEQKIGHEEGKNGGGNAG